MSSFFDSIITFFKWICEKKFVKLVVSRIVKLTIAHEISKYTNQNEYEILKQNEGQLLEKAINVMWQEHPEWMVLFDDRIKYIIIDILQKEINKRKGLK